VLFRVFGWVCGVLLRVCLGSSCKSFFSFSFFNKTPYYLSKKKKLVLQMYILSFFFLAN
jgi:hypothetical protein